jgi:hypothetical protein
MIAKNTVPVRPAHLPPSRYRMAKADSPWLGEVQVAALHDEISLAAAPAFAWKLTTSGQLFGYGT